jgi:1-deoxy-D-xylulose-5-phosphate reductoisomerase
VLLTASCPCGGSARRGASCHAGARAAPVRVRERAHGVRATIGARTVSTPTTPERKRLLILGSTGSIGTQALEVCERSEEFELVGLSAERSWEALVAQARAHGVRRIALADEDMAARAAEAWTDGEVLGGAEGLVRLIVDARADLVLNALVGSAGLAPTVAALGEGIDLALANKESLVVGGELVVALAEATGARIVPVDSEHAALHQLITRQPPGAVQRLTITASGGPFRGRTRAELEDVTVKQALSHPTWAMGGKITIDSATLMNKGLEVMEAHHLFGTPYERIDVVVHPQSLVHGLIELADGALLAHLGPPDMRIAISYALHAGESVELPIDALDLAAVGELTFEGVDLDAFPCLRLARAAALAGGTAPCVLNAANEVAVHAFLAGGLPFLAIPEVIERTLAELGSEPVRDFESLYDADMLARRHASDTVAALG